MTRTDKDRTQETYVFRKLQGLLFACIAIKSTAVTHKTAFNFAPLHFVKNVK